jgi:WD40 repeat protein
MRTFPRYLLAALLLMVVAYPAPAEPPPRVDFLGDPLPDGAVRRYGSSRLRHTGRVEALAYSPDGKLLASCATLYSGDGMIRLWDADTGKLVRAIDGGQPSAVCLAWSPDGKTLAGGSDGRTRLWDVASGKEIRCRDVLSQEERKNREQVRGFGEPIPQTRSVVFSPDGSTLLSVGSHRLFTWDTKTGAERYKLEGGKIFTPQFAAFTPDGKRLVTADIGKMVEVWDARTARRLLGFEVEGPDRQVNIFNLAAAPDGKHAALTLLNHLVVLELESGKVVKRRKKDGDHEEPISFSSDGTLIALAGRPAVRVWDWAADREVARLDERDAVMRRVCFRPGSKQLAWTGDDGVIFVWDAAAGREVLRQVGQRGGIEHFLLRPDGKAFVTVDRVQTLRLWEAGAERPARELRFPDHLTPDSLAFTHDRKAIVAGDFRSRLATVDLAGENTPRVLTGPLKDRYMKAIAPGGETALATDPYSILSHIVTGAGKDWTTYRGPATKCYDARFSPDGKFAYLHGDDNAACLELATHRLLWREPANMNVNYFGGCYALSPDGKLLAGGGAVKLDEKDGGCVRVWDTATGRLVRTLRTPQFRLSAAAFSPDGCVLVAASRPSDHLLVPRGDGHDYLLTAWEVASGTEIVRFSGHTGAVSGLAFAANGRTFLSANRDGTVLEWDWLRLDRTTPLRTDDENEVWNELASDAAKAYRAVARFVGSPKEGQALLSARLKPTPAVGLERLEKLLRQLDDDRFATRDAADRELREYGEQGVMFLRRALKEKLSVEAKRRVEEIVADLQERPYPPDELRRQRIVSALELIGSKEAINLLEAVTKTDADVCHVRQARDALKRLQQR